MNAFIHQTLAAWSGEDLLGGITEFAVLLAKAIAILAGAWFAGKIAEGVVYRIAERDPERRGIIRLLGQVAKIAVMGMGLVMALSAFGVDILPLIAGLGLTGLALGLALKDLLTSTIAGVVILLSRPFHEGDHVTVAGFEGKVIDINLRYTRLQGEDKEFLIPNSTVMSSPVTVVRNSGVEPGIPAAVQEEAAKSTTAKDKESPAE